MSATAVLCSAFVMSAYKVGDEFLVNTHTDGPQMQPSCAKLSNGGFAVAWESRWQDSSNWGVFGQAFDHLSNKTGDEFQANTHTQGSQKDPSVAGLLGVNANEFVITWASKQQDGTDYGIRAQRFNLTGTPLGDEYVINTFTDGRQRQPSISAFTNGGYIIAWDSYGQDSSEYGVYAQIFDSNHDFVGSEIAVNTHTDLNQQEPAVTVLCNQGFVVTWTSMWQDGSRGGVYYQVFDSTGKKVGAERQVHTTTEGMQSEPAVTAFDCGGFLIAWQGKGSSGSRKDIHAQVFNANGNQWGDEHVINTNVEGQQKFPEVRTLANGHYVIAWETDIDGHTDIHAQEYDLYGYKFGFEYKVNTYIEDSQSWPAVCSWDHMHGYLVAWTSDVLGDEEGIHAQKFFSEKTAVPNTAAPPTPEPLRIWTRTSLDSQNFGTSHMRMFNNYRNMGKNPDGIPGTSLWYGLCSYYGYPEYKAILEGNNDILYLFWHRAHLLMFEYINLLIDIPDFPDTDIDQSISYWNLQERYMYLFFWQGTATWPEGFWPEDKTEHLPELIRGPETFFQRLDNSGLNVIQRLYDSMDAVDFAAFSLDMEYCSTSVHTVLGGDLAGTEFRGTDFYHYIVQNEIDRHFEAYMEKHGVDTVEQYMLDNYPTEYDSDLGFNHPWFGTLTPRKILRTQEVGYKFESLEILPP